MTTKHVYQAINEIQAALAETGIAKARENKQQGYKFRGIDDVYLAVAPLLAKHGLCILPKVTGRELVERITKSGTALFYVTVTVEYDLVSTKDGSLHTIIAVGEAMDSGDKATNKAMSAAYKYACLQTFCIPTDGDNDADATTHEPIVPQQPKAESKPKPNIKTVISMVDLCSTAEELEAAKAEIKLIWGDIKLTADRNAITAAVKEAKERIARNV